MAPEAGRCLHDAADQRLAEITGLTQADAERREQSGHLRVDHGTEDLVPAPGKTR